MATAIFYGLLGSRLREASADKPRQSIVVAARVLERGATVTAADVKLSTWGGQYPLKGGYSGIEQVTGKTIASAVQEKELLRQARLGAFDGSAGIGIPAGMRAVSVHASDSSGGLALLRPGQKVDVQVVTGDRGVQVKLRTALESVEVLSVSPPDANGGRSAAPVITLLATPENADRLALADAGARIRLLLRNQLDEGRGARPGLSLASIFSDWDAPSRGLVARTHQAPSQAPSQTVSSLAAPVAAEHYAGIGPGRVRLLVLIASAGPEALAQLIAQATVPHEANALQVVALPAGPAAAQMLSALEENHQIEILSSTELSAGNARQVGVEAGGGRGCRLRIRLLASLGGHGTLRLRVTPEILAAHSSAIRARRMQTEVELVEGQPFLITGLTTSANRPLLAERLFAVPPKSSGNR